MCGQKEKCGLYEANLSLKGQCHKKCCSSKAPQALYSILQLTVHTYNGKHDSYVASATAQLSKMLCAAKKTPIVSIFYPTKRLHNLSNFAYKRSVYVGTK